MAGSALVVMERFFALLTIIAGSGAILLVVGRLVPATADLVDMIRPARLWLAAVVATVCVAGSLYFSENANFTPCKLCWFQRIAMYPLAVMLLIAAVRRDIAIRIYAIPIAAIGGLISAYHYLIEWRPSLSKGSCDITAPCTVPWFRQFGFISLPLMALSGFAAIISLLTLGEVGGHQARELEEQS